MATKKTSSTSDKLKDHGKNLIEEGNARQVIFLSKSGHQYVKMNTLVALILVLLLPYVALVVLLVALFGGLDIEIVTKEQVKPVKKVRPVKKTPAKKIVKKTVVKKTPVKKTVAKKEEK